MCELIDKYVKKGIQCAMLSSIQKLMKNMQMTAGQAMAVLEISEEDQQKYMQLI